MYKHDCTVFTLYKHDCTLKLLFLKDIFSLQVEPRLCGLEEDSFPLPYTRVERPEGLVITEKDLGRAKCLHKSQ